MKWYWTEAGGHTHVRVFMNGAKCGDLCFRNAEFQRIIAGVDRTEFINETPEPIVEAVGEVRAKEVV